MRPRSRRAAFGPTSGICGKSSRTALPNSHQPAKTLKTLCDDAPATAKPTLAPPPATAQTARKGRLNFLYLAELLRRTFGLDVLACEKCKGRMKLVALVTDPKSVTRYLAAAGELVEVPDRSPSRGPPYWKSVVLRRKAGAAGDE